MKKASSVFTHFELRGLEIGSAQLFGNVRLVPLLRKVVREDLRLARRSYDEKIGIVALDGDPLEPQLAYASTYVPHGFVVSYSEDGVPVASFGATLAAAGKARDGRAVGSSARLLHRMVKREGARSLRMLPMHLAMEGFLALHFGGPSIAWAEYSRRALSRGLDPRSESAVSGSALPGFDDALRVFEIHERQTGMLVFIADALASAFVVPHPNDYRLLHRTMLEDFFGDLLYRYGCMYPDVMPYATGIDDRKIRSLEDLRAAASLLRSDQAEFARYLTSGVLTRPVKSEVVYDLGPFQLSRFMTDLRLHEENHIGETILRDDGSVEYLKTYRLSDAQARRAHLLEILAANEWHLERTAKALSTTKAELVRRIVKAGFEYLLKANVARA